MSISCVRSKEGLYLKTNANTDMGLKKNIRLLILLILAASLCLQSCKTSEKRPGKIPKKGAIPCPC